MGISNFGTYISQTLHWDINKLCHLIIPSEDLACSTPAAGRDSHTGKDAVVLHKTPLEPHLHQNQFDISQALHAFSELGPELIKLPQNLLPRYLLHVLFHVLVQSCISLDIVERFQQTGVIFRFEKLVHSLLWWVRSCWVGGSHVVCFPSFVIAHRGGWSLNGVSWRYLALCWRRKLCRRSQPTR